MKKLQLSLDALKVESFQPEASPAERAGSVVAHAQSWNPEQCATYDPRDYRCYFSADLGGHDCTPVCYSGGAAGCDTIELC